MRTVAQSGVLPTVDIHPDIVHLQFLLGTWRGGGEGEYPTIEDFAYREEVTFAHGGKPFVSYVQRTSDATTGLPLHAESGYFRPAGPERLELVLSQPSGIVELHEGTVVGQVIDLRSTHVLTTATAKSVTAVRRRLSVERDILIYDLSMAAVGQPLSHHLSATLSRTG